APQCWCLRRSFFSFLPIAPSLHLFSPPHDHCHPIGHRGQHPLPLPPLHHFVTTLVITTTSSSLSSNPNLVPIRTAPTPTL
ncbi:hypothetical protein B0O80DRAFT_398293, partial [Mortierella sp. GBAus27b]